MGRLALEPEGNSHDPEQLQRRKELASLLTRALDSLPLEQRVTFVLCEVEERTSREVAAITGVPEGTVRMRLHHARASRDRRSPEIRYARPARRNRR